MGEPPALSYPGRSCMEPWALVAQHEPHAGRQGPGTSLSMSSEPAGHAIKQAAHHRLMPVRAQPHHHSCQELGGVLKAQSGLQVTQKMVSLGSCRPLQHCHRARDAASASRVSRRGGYIWPACCCRATVACRQSTHTPPSMHISQHEWKGGSTCSHSKLNRLNACWVSSRMWSGSSETDAFHAWFTSYLQHNDSSEVGWRICKHKAGKNKQLGDLLRIEAAIS